MLTLFSVVALAGAPPEGVDPDDIDRWASLAGSSLDKPAGCWELTGTVTSVIGIQARVTGFRRLDSKPTRRTGTFSGRIEEGTWTRFDYQLDPVKDGSDVSTDVSPFFGTLPPDVVRQTNVEPVVTDSTSKSEVSVGKGSDVMRTWRKLTGTVDSQWDSSIDAMRVTETLQLPDDYGGGLATAITVFPGGESTPARLSVTYPRHIKGGQWPVYIHVYDAQSHVLFQTIEGVALPIAESVSGRIAALGVNGAIEDRLDYKTAQRCP